MKFSDKVEYNINKADLEKNIKEFDSSIDVINKILDDCEDEVVKTKLNKDKHSLETCLKKLIELKEKNKKSDD